MLHLQLTIGYLSEDNCGVHIMDRLYLDDRNGLIIDHRAIEAIKEKTYSFKLRFTVSENAVSKATKWNVLGTSIVQLSFESYFIVHMSEDGCADVEVISTHDIRFAEDCSDLFNGSNIKGIDFSNIDLSHIRNMERMFADVRLAEIDLSGQNLSSVECFDYVFEDSVITKINLSNLKLTSVNSCRAAFSNIQSTDLIMANTEIGNGKVKCNDLFNCAYISDYLDTTNMKINGATTVKSMFENAYIGGGILNLTDLIINIDNNDISNEFDCVFTNTVVHAEIILTKDLLLDYGTMMFKSLSDINLPKIIVCEGNISELLIGFEPISLLDCVLCPLCKEKAELYTYTDDDGKHFVELNCESCGTGIKRPTDYYDESTAETFKSAFAIELAVLNIKAGHIIGKNNKLEKQFK